jgi:hypothetical protein
MFQYSLSKCGGFAVWMHMQNISDSTLKYVQSGMHDAAQVRTYLQAWNFPLDVKIVGTQSRVVLLIAEPIYLCREHSQATLHMAICRRYAEIGRIKDVLAAIQLSQITLSWIPEKYPESGVDALPNKQRPSAKRLAAQ